jgi:ribonuclease Y
VLWAAIALAGIPGGIIAGYFFRKSWAVREAASAESKANALIEEAKRKQKDLLLDAKAQAMKVIEEAKKEDAARRVEVSRVQERLEKREATFDQKLLDLEKQRQESERAKAEFEKAKEEIAKIRDEQFAKLEKIAELTRDDAKRVLMENVETRMKDELSARVRKLQTVGQEEWERESKKLLSTVIQRVASPHSMETTTTVVALPNDELKGRIIGREGRNIKALEQLTGVEIIVDETPESIVISGFNSVRRHVAKRALERLIADGRIHPGRIEEAVEQAKKELNVDIKKAGEEAAYECGVAGLSPQLIQLLGRLKYRTSYGQSVLRHSVEVCLLSVMLAQELKANVNVVRKGGLLHDIGKAVDHEVQGGHPQIGYDLMKKFGLPEEVAYMSVAHHEDSPKTLEGVIVKVADAISGARPGARKDTYEQYVQRLEDLEAIATQFPGVEKCYAIQAGREVRVFVMPDKIDDAAMLKLAQEVAGKIESELQYPGEIKVNVIREKRVVEYAR